MSLCSHVKRVATYIHTTCDNYLQYSNYYIEPQFMTNSWASCVQVNVTTFALNSGVYLLSLISFLPVTLPLSSPATTGHRGIIIRDAPILLLISSIFLSSNSFKFHLLCSKFCSLKNNFAHSKPFIYLEFISKTLLSYL